MEFKTQHRNTKIRDSKGREQSYRAHRDYNSVWLTSDGAVVFERVFNTVSEAGRWMISPSFTY